MTQTETDRLWELLRDMDGKLDDLKDSIGEQKAEFVAYQTMTDAQLRVLREHAASSFTIPKTFARWVGATITAVALTVGGFFLNKVG